MAPDPGRAQPSTGLDADRQTVFNAVEQLLPGEAMFVDLESLDCRIWRYWQIEPGDLRENVDEREVFAEFRDLLTDAVRLRLRSDVPVGSCLSGGLDSSAIVCLVREMLGEEAPYNTFTGRFPGTAADEWQFAEQVIDRTGVTAHVTEPTVERFLDDLPEFMWHNELPVGSSSQFAQWCVFRLAAEHGVTVLLDGQGADEALGGYEQYFRFYVQALRERGETERLEQRASADPRPLPAGAHATRTPMARPAAVSAASSDRESNRQGLQPALRCSTGCWQAAPGRESVPEQRGLSRPGQCAGAG